MPLKTLSYNDALYMITQETACRSMMWCKTDVIPTNTWLQQRVNSKMRENTNFNCNMENWTTNSVVGVVMEIVFGILHKRGKFKVNLFLGQYFQWFTCTLVCRCTAVKSERKNLNWTFYQLSKHLCRLV